MPLCAILTLCETDCITQQEPPGSARVCKRKCPELDKQIKYCMSFDGAQSVRNTYQSQFCVECLCRPSDPGALPTRLLSVQANVFSESDNMTKESQVRLPAGMIISTCAVCASAFVY